MRGNQHGCALVAQLFDDLHEHRLAALVHAGEGLIQQQQLGTLGDSACHEGALTLTARERPNLTVGKVGQFHAGERLIHGGTVRGTQAAGDAEVAVASHADNLTHGDGEGPVDFFALRHVANESGAVVVRALAAVTADGLPVEGDAAGVHKRSEAMLMQVIKQLRDEGATVLVSTHDLATLRQFADEALLLRGEILMHDTPEKVLAPENLVRAFGMEVDAGASVATAAPGAATSGTTTISSAEGKN